MLRKHELTINDGDGDRLELEYDQNHSHEYLHVRVKDCDELSSVPVYLNMSDIKTLHRYLIFILDEMDYAKEAWDLAEKEAAND